MDAAKIFTNGDNQDVRLPKEDCWLSLISSLELFTDDFLSEELEKLPPENRETID